MKKSYLITLLLLILSIAVFSLTVDYVTSIDISAEGDGPIGLAFYNGSVFTVTFNDRKIIKVDDPVSGSPVVSTFADTSSLLSWPTGRGLTGIDIDSSTGDTYVSGDYGSGGSVFKYDSSGTLVNSFIDTTADHRNGGCTLWGSTPDLLICQSGKGMFDMLNTLTGYDSPGWISGGVNATTYYRDVAVVGDDFYVSRTYYPAGLGASGPDGIDKFTGGTAGDLTGYTADGWIDLADGTAQAGCGIYYWLYANIMGPFPISYILYANQLDKTLDFYLAEIAGVPTKALTLGATENVTDPRDSCVGVIGVDEFLFVSQSATNEILVFEIDGGGITKSHNWSLFE